jgi:hypothetical protein
MKSYHNKVLSEPITFIIWVKLNSSVVQSQSSKHKALYQVLLYIYISFNQVSEK